MTQYRDRRTGRLVTERVFAGDAIRWFYTSGAGSAVFDVLVNRAWFCWLYGRLQDTRPSARKIPAFVRQFGIDATEAVRPLYSYRTFNQFFSRALRPDARPWVSDPARFPAPAEGKLLVFGRLEGGSRIPIKGANVAIEALVGAEEALPFHGGSAIVVRLAPYDYHRFHFSDDGEAGPSRSIPGSYHSVNPIAFGRVPDLLCRNKRAVTRLDSANFGRIACVEVGALCVGTILQTFSAGAVIRGQEKGYFLFGGSTVVLLFEPEAVVFDDDLIADSEAGLEVQVQVGSGIGRRA